eukprot:COSAG05_NODE_564_length_8647_cov_65.428872_3_plen_474_part_00
MLTPASNAFPLASQGRHAPLLQMAVHPLLLALLASSTFPALDPVSHQPQQPSGLPAAAAAAVDEGGVIGQGVQAAAAMNGSTVQVPFDEASAMLLEASGAAEGPLSFSTHVSLPCGEAKEVLIVTGNTSTVYLLRGPTPYTIVRTNLNVSMRSVHKAVALTSSSVAVLGVAATTGRTVIIRISVKGTCESVTVAESAVQLSFEQRWTDMAKLGTQLVLLDRPTGKLLALSVHNGIISGARQLHLGAKHGDCLAIGSSGNQAPTPSLLLALFDSGLLAIDLATNLTLMTWPHTALGFDSADSVVGITAANILDPEQLSVVLAWNSPRGAKLTLLPPVSAQQPTLVEGVVLSVDPSPRGWHSIFAVPLLNNASGTQLVALRRPNMTAIAARFELNTLVIGPAQFTVSRQSGQRLGRGQCFMNELQGLAKRASSFSIPAFLEQIRRTHTNPYMYRLLYKIRIACLNITSLRGWSLP